MIRRSRILAAAAILLLLLVGFTRAARADYDARRAAVKEVISKSSLTKEEKEALTKAFNSYFDQRSQCLKELVEILKDDDDDEQAGPWHARAARCQTDGAKTMGEALSGVDKPSEKAQHLLDQLKVEENKFFNALSGMTVAEQRDVIVALGTHLQEMTRVLVNKWYSIQNSDKSIDARLKAAVDKIDRQISDVMRAAADKHKDASVKLAEFIKAWGENPVGTGTSIDNFMTLLAALSRGWILKKTQALEFATVEADVQRQEVRLILIFNEVREDTDDFLEKGSFENARAALKKAQYSAHGFVGNVSAPGQKDDAGVFRTRALDALARHMEATEKIWVKFVSEEKGKFFGAVSPDIEEALIEKRDTDRWRRQLEDHRLQRMLADWRSDAKNFFGVSFSGLTSKQRSELKSKIQPHIDKYVEAMKDMEEAEQKVLEGAKARDQLEDEFDD